MSTLPTANKCLLANLLLFVSGEGDEATSPSFTTSYEPIQASNASVETVILAWCVQWGCKCGTVYPRQTNTCLPIFYFLRVERATRQRHPLLQLKIRGLMLLARCWKRSLQHSKCSGDANGSGLPTANNYLFADLFLFKSGEGEEATSPSFATSYEPIQASNPCWKCSFQVGAFSEDANANISPTANKYLFADLFLFKSGEGDEATSPSFAAEMQGLMLPACCWKHLLQHRKCGDANGSGLPDGKQLPVCRSFILYRRRGRRGNVALFFSCKQGE